MRFATDTGGTFTDLMVDDGDGRWSMYKASTTPEDPVRGVIDALRKAAEARSLSLEQMLGRGKTFVHGTTHAINAIITGHTARTAFLTTQGHPDILLLREGGRTQPFNHTIRYPDPYVPRRLTFEIPGRIGADGRIVEPLDEKAVLVALERIRNEGVEAIGVCFLWSISNPEHERRVGALIERHLPGIPFTLSHQLNPTLREYRRASSACMDASLKPLMGTYLGSLTHRLEEAGFKGQVYVVSSQGGMMSAATLAQAPIHSINSGPSMAPISGRYYAAVEGDRSAVIVADTGGTTYDVSLVRDDHIPTTREMWVGEPYLGHMTGFPSVDVKSIGAGGGSIARVDAGGMLHVGPESAGSVPGPACYGRGGTEPTLTDACLVLGYLDPDYFLGGAMKVAPELAEKAILEKVARPLGVSLHAAAWAIVDLATENMTQAIVDITVNQGIDPSEGVLIGGGGAAGLNSVFIAARLGCKRLIIPEVGAALSAAGALMSDLTAEYRATEFMTTAAFDPELANRTLDVLREQCSEFLRENSDQIVSHSIEMAVEARYPNQVWEIDVSLPVDRFTQPGDLEQLREVFHAAHERIFAIRDAESEVEILTWSATIRGRVPGGGAAGQLTQPSEPIRAARVRSCRFADGVAKNTPVQDFGALVVGERSAGPAIIESPFTTVVIDPSATFTRTANGSLVIEPGERKAS